MNENATESAMKLATLIEESSPERLLAVAQTLRDFATASKTGRIETDEIITAFEGLAEIMVESAEQKKD